MSKNRSLLANFPFDSVMIACVLIAFAIWCLQLSIPGREGPSPADPRDILTAIFHDNPDELDRACQADKGDWQKSTPVDPLVTAASQGSLRVAARLLELNVDPNQQTQYGTTALMAAAWEGDAQMVRLLLQAGADPNLVDKSGRSASMHAIEANHPQIIQMLSTRSPKPQTRPPAG